MTNTLAKLEEELQEEALEFYPEWMMRHECDRNYAKCYAEFAAAFAERKMREEREADCKAMCDECKKSPAILDVNGFWIHPNTADLGWKNCRAAAIRQRGEKP